MTDRLPLTHADWSKTAVSDKELYQKVLGFVTRRKGLLHGKFNDHGRVCAMGALEAGLKRDGTYIVVNYDASVSLQKANDSCPQATPAGRRKRVMQWLQDKIEKLS